MRLIDADAMRADWLENGQNEYVYDTNAFLQSIDEQPTIEAEPVRHGEWKEWWPGSCALILTGEEMLWQCSECGTKYSDAESMHYCPNCGAKMDGGCEK